MSEPFLYGEVCWGSIGVLVIALVGGGIDCIKEGDNFREVDDKDVMTSPSENLVEHVGKIKEKEGLFGRIER